MLLWNFSFEFGCFYYLKIFYWNISTVDWNLDKKCLGLYEPQLKFLFDIRIDFETKKQHAGTLHYFLQRISCQENPPAHLSVSLAFWNVNFDLNLIKRLETQVSLNVIFFTALFPFLTQIVGSYQRIVKVYWNSS